MRRLSRSIARTAVVAATATSVSNRVARRQQGQWAEAAQSPASQGPAPDPAPPTGPTSEGMSDKLALLTQLGDLKAKGVLTEEEFTAQKQTILAT